jgi:hypothetical protein
MGMNSDHCSKEKSVADGMRNKKIQAILQQLGEKYVASKTADEIEAIFDLAYDEMVKEVGGHSAWNSLTPNERALKNASMTKKLMQSLGGEAYAKLSEAEAE